MKNIIVPNMFYRTDIGERWHRDGDLLQTWGYLHVSRLPPRDAVSTFAGGTRCGNLTAVACLFFRLALPGAAFAVTGHDRLHGRRRVAAERRGIARTPPSGT